MVYFSGLSISFILFICLCFVRTADSAGKYVRFLFCFVCVWFFFSAVVLFQTRSAHQYWLSVFQLVAQSQNQHCPYLFRVYGFFLLLCSAFFSLLIPKIEAGEFVEAILEKRSGLFVEIEYFFRSNFI